MTAFDYVVLGVILVSVAVSIWRGLVREVVSLLSWLVALWVAARFSVVFSEWLPAAIANPSARYVTAFVVLFLGTVIVLELFGCCSPNCCARRGWVLSIACSAQCSAWPAARCWRGYSTLLGGLTSLPQQDWWRESLFAPPLQAAVLAARPLLPLEIAKRLKYS